MVSSRILRNRGQDSNMSLYCNLQYSTNNEFNTTSGCIHSIHVFCEMNIPVMILGLEIGTSVAAVVYLCCKATQIVEL